MRIPFAFVLFALLATIGCDDTPTRVPGTTDVLQPDAAREDTRLDTRAADTNVDARRVEDALTIDALNDTRPTDTRDAKEDVVVNPACDDLINSFVTVANPVAPPSGGTLFIAPETLTDADPTAFVNLIYAGQANRVMFDRRTNAFETYDAHLFDAQFGTTKIVEVQVNPEFSMAEAEVEARTYAAAIGRIPAFYFNDLETVWIHRGNNLAGGGNNNLLIHTEQGVTYSNDGILEELFLHEGAHTSLDAEHANAPAWLAAQQADGTFMSTYGRDNPIREDVSETIGLWIAVRYYRERIPDALAQQIEATIPNRLLYFDCASLDVDLVQ